LGCWGVVMDSAQQVLLAHNFPRLFHDMLAGALSDHGWQVNGGQLNSREPIVDSACVNLVLVCASTKTEDTLKTVERIHTEHPRAKIVLVGVELPDNEVLQLIRSGAGAYIDIGQGFDDLLETLKMVRENRSPSRNRLTSLVLSDINRLSQSSDPDVPTSLTFRESQVLELLTKGCSNKEIAERLSITLNTVKNHVHNVLEKLNVKSRHEAAWITSSPHSDYKKAS
jgi:two-component system, NarL family, nitrate/nitrite response regulator NarL